MEEWKNSWVKFKPCLLSLLLAADQSQSEVDMMSDSESYTLDDPISTLFETEWGFML